MIKYFITLIFLITINQDWTVSEIKWAKTLEEALKNQKANGKDIIVYFGADWCGPCKLIEKHVFNTDDFVKYTQKYEMVKVYDDFKKGEKSKYEYYEITKKKFGVDAIPTFVIIKSNKDLCTISGGYYKSEELIKQLNSCN